MSTGAGSSSTSALRNRKMESASSTPNASNAGSNGAMQQALQSSNTMGVQQYNQYSSCMGAQQHPGSAHPSRNGSPVLRPPSSASTASAVSYHTATTTNNGSGQDFQPSSQHPNVGISVARYQKSNTPPAAGFGHHPSAGHFKHPPGGVVRPTGRYPMPPRSNRGGGNSTMHVIRSGCPGQTGNSYNPHHHGGGTPQPHHYPQQQHHSYGSMATHYEYHQSNYSLPEHLPQHGNVPPPPPSRATAPSPMQTENNKQPCKENQGYNMKGFKDQDPQQEQAVATSNEGPSAPGTTEFESQPEEASAMDEQRAVLTNGEQDVGMQQQGDANHYQQQYHHYHQEQQGVPSYPVAQQYQPHQGYPREQHYHQSSFPHHQPYNHHHQRQHGVVYGQHGAVHVMRYGNFHHGGVGAVSPPPPPQQAAVPYYPSDYQLGQAAAGHPGQYSMHSQEHCYYQNHQGYGNDPPQGAFQLPNYTTRRGSFNPSPETTMDAQTMSRSPSPPPKPPGPSPTPQTTLLDKTGKSIASDSSESSKIALGERGQNSVSKDGSTGGKVPGKSVDGTADAASILLQLAAPLLKPGDSENEKPQTATDDAKIPGSVQGAGSMDEASEMTHPDLTSEPSQDSVEQAMQNRVLDTEFPCPIPAKYPTRLCLPYDGAKLNSLHCFLRSDLLEIFVVQKSPLKSPTHSPHSSIGRVGLRCVHCGMNRRHRDDREEAPMAVFYPKSVAEIYRLVTSWQRCHLRKCHNLPPAVRSKWLELRETDKSRGKTHYWVTSAKEIGLRDCQGRAGGIRFAPDLDGNSLPPQTKPAIYSPLEETRISPRNRMNLPVQQRVARVSSPTKPRFPQAMATVSEHHGNPSPCSKARSGGTPNPEDYTNS